MRITLDDEQLSKIPANLTIENAVPLIKEYIRQGNKQAAKEIVMRLAQTVPFPRIDEVMDEYDDASQQWTWGSWGPDDDLIANALVTVEESFLQTAGNLMSTKGLQRGRDIAAEGIDAQGAYYSAFIEGDPCDLCRGLDGTEVAYPSQEYNDFSPPQHCFCRCIWLYISAGEEDFTPDENIEDRILNGANESSNNRYVSIDDLLQKKGHANPKFEAMVAKMERDMEVTKNVLNAEVGRWLSQFIIGSDINRILEMMEEGN